ncbi:MAG: methyltransferase [Thermodesulfobacteriota bacterium]
MADDANPAILFDNFFAFIRTGVMKAALELDLFTHIARGHRTADALARAAGGDPRGVRILLDTLCVFGFLDKDASGAYALRPLAEAMLVRGSPAYAGGFMRITANRWLWDAVGKLTDVVRSGKPPEAMVDTPGHEFWVEFAEASEQMSSVGAGMVAGLLELDPTRPLEVLDVACGSGVYGFAVLDAVPGAHVTALDWPNVLEQTRRVAEKRGLADRVTWLGGSAFEAPLPERRFDLVLASNFYHHFSPEQNVELSRRLLATLKPGGTLAIQDWVADDRRTGPPQAVLFAVVMLASTRSGDVYTLAEYRRILESAGFVELRAREVPLIGAQLLLARRPA